MTHVLVVDDDAHLLRTLRIHLTAHGYTVATADTGRDAIHITAADHPDLIVLDLGLPDLDGTAVISALRAHWTMPIIVLSARTDAPDKVQALDTGADDYVTKPFGITELLARIRAAVRRADQNPHRGDADTEQATQTVVHTPAFTVDLTAKKVSRHGQDLRLTPTEWAILEILVRHRGALVTQRRLLTEVWGPNYRTQTNCLRVYLAQLRQKLEPEPAAPPLPHHRTWHGLPIRTDNQRVTRHKRTENSDRPPPPPGPRWRLLTGQTCPHLVPGIARSGRYNRSAGRPAGRLLDRRCKADATHGRRRWSSA